MSRKYWQRMNRKQLIGSVQKLFTTDGAVKSSKPLFKFQMFCKPNRINTGQLQACKKQYFCQKHRNVTVKLMREIKRWSKDKAQKL